MYKSLFMAFLVTVTLIGCGGEPEEPTPPSENAPASDAPKKPEAPVVAQVQDDKLPEPFELAAATQDEIQAVEVSSTQDDEGDDVPVAEPMEEVDEITSTGTATKGSQFKFLTGDTAPDTLPGFEWVDEKAAAEKEAQMKAQQEAEVQAGIAAVEKDDAIKEELAALKAEQERMLAELKAAQEKAEQDKLAAEAEAETARMEAEANAMAKLEAQKELERIQAETEKQRLAAMAEAEAARKDAAASAEERMKAQAALEEVQAEAERERIAAEADAESAREEAEIQALAKKEALEELVRVQAESEAALLKAREEKEMADAQPELTVATEDESTTNAAPAGSIQLAKLDLDAQQNGKSGVGLGSEAQIENLNGAKVELAAYFFDSKGNPLKDTDKINRSSRGQVYVGKESIVPSDEYELSDTLFIPFDQLDLPANGEHEVQVELVLWEYSQGRGARLAASPKASFKHRSTAVQEAKPTAVMQDLTGTWKHEDTTMTIVQKGTTVALNGLAMVPNNIISEQWTYENGILHGSVVSKKNFPALIRVWEFNLTTSPDGNTLTGTFHRADKKGNFAFDSEPFTWTRVD